MIIKGYPKKIKYFPKCYKKSTYSIRIHHIKDRIVKSTEKFKKHNKKLIKGSFLKCNTFSFEEISVSETEKELRNLGSSRTVQESDISTKIIKIILIFLPPSITRSIGKFPSETSQKLGVLISYKSSLCSWLY